MPKFIFDTSKGVYRFSTSRRIAPQKRIDAVVAKAADTASKNLKKLAVSFAQGNITHPTWVLDSTEQIKNAHRAVAMVASGGRDRMGLSEWGHVGSRIRSEMAYFNAFSNQVAGMDIDAPGFAARAASYGQSVYITHAEGLARRHEKDGTATTESNELEAGAVHCDGCLEATDAGEVPIGTLVPVGARECGSRCRCRLVYSA